MADARIFAALKADHDRHRALLEKIAAADADKRAEPFEAFRVEVTAHAAAEEESLYAAMLAKPDLRDDARHSVSEHKEIDDYLGVLAKLDAASDEWATQFAALRHRYEHHIGEEEDEMFPAAAEGLTAQEEARIAEVFERRKPKELAMATDSESGSDKE